MSEMKACPHCSERKKKRTAEEQNALLRRLKLAEGQIRGIRKMVEEDAYCPDILIQVSAVSAEDIRNGKEEAIDEFVKVMQKLMK